MPKIDAASVSSRKGSDYPVPFAQACAARVRRCLGEAGGLTQFGVNLLKLEPGAWSSQRHWHTHEDEFVYIVSGEVVLITDRGEELLRAGDCAAFPHNAPDGHHLVNRSASTAVCLEVGSRVPADSTVYPDIDLLFDGGLGGYTRKDGSKHPVA
jgi:uncharacterized cupin superfamily protein